jgi:hypothetical protein
LCVSRTGAQRTLRYVSTGSAETRNLQPSLTQKHAPGCEGAVMAGGMCYPPRPVYDRWEPCARATDAIGLPVKEGSGHLTSRQQHRTGTVPVRERVSAPGISEPAAPHSAPHSRIIVLSGGRCKTCLKKSRHEKAPAQAPIPPKPTPNSDSIQNR